MEKTKGCLSIKGGKSIEENGGMGDKGGEDGEEGNINDRYKEDGKRGRRRI